MKKLKERKKYVVAAKHVAGYPDDEEQTINITQGTVLIFIAEEDDSHYLFRLPKKHESGHERISIRYGQAMRDLVEKKPFIEFTGPPQYALPIIFGTVVMIVLFIIALLNIG